MYVFFKLNFCSILNQVRTVFFISLWFHTFLILINSFIEKSIYVKIAKDKKYFIQNDQNDFKVLIQEMIKDKIEAIDVRWMEY